jgi:hypothetical protein
MDDEESVDDESEGPKSETLSAPERLRWTGELGREGAVSYAGTWSDMQTPARTASLGQSRGHAVTHWAEGASTRRPCHDARSAAASASAIARRATSGSGLARKSSSERSPCASSMLAPST